jgi:hypothetical protein
MTIRIRHRRAILALALGLVIPLSGCFGTSEDKGDNGGSIITPKPGKVEDANTAGSRKTVLPEPSGTADPKSAAPAETPPK